MVACKYGISLQLEEKFHIYARPCIILYISCSQPPTPCIILYLSCSPPHPIIEKIRQYNHNSSLELPHYIYISIRLKYNLQKFGFVYVNYVNEHKNSGTKSS